jgi:hypothetical protein
MPQAANLMQFRAEHWRAPLCLTIKFGENRAKNVCCEKSYRINGC